MQDTASARRRPARLGSGVVRLGVRAAAVLAAAVYLTVFALALPGYWRRLTTFCSLDCAPWQPDGITQDALASLGTPLPVYAAAVLAGYVIASSVYLVVAGVLVARRPTGWYLRLVTAVLVASGALGPMYVYADVLGMDRGPVQLLVGVTTLWLWPALGLFLVCFPDGRLSPRWSVLIPIAFSLRTWLYVWDHPAARTAVTVTGLLCYGAAIGVQVYRYRRRYDDRGRQQAKWFIYFFAVGYLLQQAYRALPYAFPGIATAPGYVLLDAVIPLLNYVTWPLGVAVAIIRHRLWDIDVVLRRTIVYTTLTVLVSAIYLGVVTVVATLVPTAANPIGVVIAAASFQPLRSSLHRAVTRMLYGERDDPYRIMALLGDRLADGPEQSVLQTTVATITSALRLPYGALQLTEGDEPAPVGPAAAEVGVRPDDDRLLVAVDLVHRGHRVGRLLLAPRAGESWLQAADQRILADIARHAAAVIQSVRLSEQLQSARQALVNATEEERRRLRRDLHDGLGSQLASMGLTVAAARTRLGADPAIADRLLRELGTHLHTAMEDVRRLVYELRPPTLDELGLVQALRLHAQHQEAGGLTIAVRAAEPLPALPAAVEAAAYRIVQEALTNVIRHARATRCDIELTTVGADLLIEVRDDGVGIDDTAPRGVGLLSMVERTTELGGRCRVRRRTPTGTVVRAELPLPADTKGTAG